MPEPRILLSGLGIPESPRWHDGRLWFCNWIDRQVVAVNMDGTSRVMLTRDPASLSPGTRAMIQIVEEHMRMLHRELQPA